MAKSPDEMTATMIANLAEKTGKTLEQWVKLAAKSGLAKHGELVSWLKAEHGIGHGYANLIAHTHFSGGKEPEGDDLVAAQYSGKKADLRPLYDKLVGILQGFGSDVELAPKKAYVSVRRSKQFAILQPSTATRLDVGINLKGTPPSGRLEASGSFNAMVSHRVRVESAGDIDGDLKKWLKAAYEAS